jgi:hypothetical protein
MPFNVSDNQDKVLMATSQCSRQVPESSSVHLGNIRGNPGFGLDRFKPITSGALISGN